MKDLIDDVDKCRTEPSDSVKYLSRSFVHSLIALPMPAHIPAHGPAPTHFTHSK